MSDADSRARVLTTAPPRRVRSARATSRPPPPPRATPPGASHSPFSDTPRVCGSVRSRFRLSNYSGKTSVFPRRDPSRVRGGAWLDVCLTRQTNPRVLTRPQNKNTQKQPRLGSVRARGARRPARWARTDSRPRRSPRRRRGPGFRATPLAAADVVEVPAMGDSITEGSIAAVLKGPGDAVEVDEVIAQIETDKVTIDVRAAAAGAVVDVLVRGRLRYGRAGRVHGRGRARAHQERQEGVEAAAPGRPRPRRPPPRPTSRCRRWATPSPRAPSRR